MFILDNNVLSHAFKNIKIESFPTFWYSLDKLIQTGEVVSSREVFRELEGFFVMSGKSDNDVVTKWLKEHKHMFLTPTKEDCKIVGQIFSKPHFKQLVKKHSLLNGNPEADVFIIAQAVNFNAIVVTFEEFTKNGAKIPNVCKDFNVIFIGGDEFFRYVNNHFDDNLKDEYYGGY